MASKTTVIYYDDIDETEGASTVTFAFDGTNYEIDLSEANSAKLRAALEPFIQAGRKVGRGPGRSRSTAKASGVSAAEVRAWAKDNGYTVPDRGRIPADVREAFDAAN